jgi:hypothetical protein
VLLYVVGWLAIVFLYSIVAARWFDLHQQTHNNGGIARRPGSVRQPRGSRRIYRAQWRRDPDPAVEKRRRAFLLVLAIAIAYLVIGFPLAVLLIF